MKPMASALILAALIVTGQAAEPDESWEIRGKVVDEQGMPVENFVAATFWSSNGQQWDEHGEPIKVRGNADTLKLWKEEGVMAAFPQSLAERRGGGGEFRAKVEGRPRVSVFATDAEQRHGGYVPVERGAAAQEVTITLAPLVRVHGKIYCADAERTPDWTMVVVHPPADKQNYLHFTHCGSVRGEFAMLLPPGPFDLDVYSSSPDARMPRASKGDPPHAADDSCRYSLRVEVPTNRASLDLGTLNVELPVGPDGKKGDYSRYYDKEPPELAITDARGVSKDVKLSDYRGKWVLVEFWTLWCGPCVHRSLPNFAELYSKYSDRRDRFEILAICVTKEEKIRTIKEYEAREATLVKDVWAGKPLPFPVLIDGEGKTQGAYGITHYPTVLLIDPEGKLVKFGDEALLEEKLKEPSSP